MRYAGKFLSRAIYSPGKPCLISATFQSFFRLVCCSLLAPVIFSSCNNDKDGDGIPDNKDKCPAQAASTPNGCPMPVPVIGDVRFFMDRSGSMAGYYTGGSAFVDNIGNLLAEVNDKRPVREIWLVSDTAEKFEGDAGAFRDQLVRTPPKGGKSSMMNAVFESIAAKTGSNDISIFVSDGILSFTDKDIKKNHNINKEYAQKLGTDIFDIFSRLRKNKDFGVSLYAFKSDFTGIYYNCQNGQKRLKDAVRPYYIWVIGQHKLLKQFDAELAALPKFQPEGQLHFGTDAVTITDATILPSLERTGDWKLNRDGAGISDIGKKPARFSMVLNLDTLPVYARQLSFLIANLRIDTKGCVASVSVKAKQDVEAGKVRGKRQKEKLETATHVIIVDVQQMRTESAAVRIILPAAHDTWYYNWSCDDDMDLSKSCPERTFSFKVLVDGLAQAYRVPATNYLDISIPLQQ